MPARAAMVPAPALAPDLVVSFPRQEGLASVAWGWWGFPHILPAPVGALRRHNDHIRCLAPVVAVMPADAHALIWLPGFPLHSLPPYLPCFHVDNLLGKLLRVPRVSPHLLKVCAVM